VSRFAALRARLPARGPRWVQRPGRDRRPGPGWGVPPAGVRRVHAAPALRAAGDGRNIFVVPKAARPRGRGPRRAGGKGSGKGSRIQSGFRRLLPRERGAYPPPRDYFGSHRLWRDGRPADGKAAPSPTGVECNASNRSGEMCGGQARGRPKGMGFGLTVGGVVDPVTRGVRSRGQLRLGGGVSGTPLLSRHGRRSSSGRPPDPDPRGPRHHPPGILKKGAVMQSIID